MSNNNNKNTRRHEAIVLGSEKKKNLNIEFYMQPNYQSSTRTKYIIRHARTQKNYPCYMKKLFKKMPSTKQTNKKESNKNTHGIQRKIIS